MGNNPRPITLYIIHDLKPQVNSIAGNPSQDCMQCSVKKSWIKLTKLDSLSPKTDLNIYTLLVCSRFTANTGSSKQRRYTETMDRANKLDSLWPEKTWFPILLVYSQPTQETATKVLHTLQDLHKRWVVLWMICRTYCWKNSADNIARRSAED